MILEILFSSFTYLVFRMSVGYSEGGTTFPDFGIFLFVVVCGLISVILNPPVMYRHLGAPFTVHRVTSFLIALLNLISSVIQIYAAFRYILPDSEDDPNTDFGGTTAGQRAYSALLSSVILIPNLLTAVMLTARYFHLRFPLRMPPKKGVFTTLAIVSIAQVIIMICFYSVNIVNIQWSVNTVMAFNWNPYSKPKPDGEHRNRNAILISMLTKLSIPSILQVAGVAFILLTISHLRRSGGGLAACQSGRDTRRITYRILVMNVGSLLHTVSLIFFVSYTFSIWTTINSDTDDRERDEGEDSGGEDSGGAGRDDNSCSGKFCVYKWSGTMFYVILPIFQSAVNPAVYFITEAAGKRKAGTERTKQTTYQNSLYRSRDCLSANQGPVFPGPVGS